MSGLIAQATLSYVRRVAGDEGVEHVRQMLGAEQALFETRYSTEWVRRDYTLALAAAVAEYTGELDLGRRVGEEYFDMHRADGTTEFFLASGSPRGAMLLSTEFAHKMSSCCDYAVREQSDTRVVVEISCKYGGDADDIFFCSLAVGYMAMIPTLFGGRASVFHGPCHTKGAPTCQLKFWWEAGLGVDGQVRDEHRRRAKESVTRLEEVQALAAELAKAQTVDEVLDGIAAGVDVAAVAPRVAVCVQLPAEPEPRVVLLGFLPGEEADAEAALRRGEAPAGGEPLTAPLRSGEFDFGRLVAVFRPGSKVANMDRRLLEAYAGHAASALEAAVIRDEIRRHKEAADDLLRMAAALARLRTPGDVLGHLLGELVSLTGARGAAAFEPDGRNFLKCATWGALTDGGPLADIVAGEALVPALDTEHVSVTSVAGTGLTMVPLVLHDHRLAVLAAVHDPDHAPDAALLRRLDGLAHHGSLALSNAQLLEQVSHKASHDALTGLPNRQFAADAASAALAQAASDGTHVGLLFVDLDRFKEVNDTLGHAVGDALLSAVSARLARCTRPGDMVARLGGDEFLIMLPRLTGSKEAVRVAKRVRDALRETFVIRGRDIMISSSVGVAIGPDDGETYEKLVARADEAMYDAKSAGRDGYVVAGEHQPPTAAPVAAAQALTA